ncbi:MAG: hypothetical protein KH452_04175 [Clostridiales bacterium]|nr:hypothetical protein [Clostridiales bacterium]
MQCPYCGYEYDDELTKCPFCATENTREAREQQRETIWSLQEEGKYIRNNLPKQLLKNANRTAAHMGRKILAGILFVLLLFGVIAVSIRTIKDLKRENNIQQLEEYLQAMELDALVSCMDEIEEYDPSYEKYYEVDSSYRYLTYAQESLGWYYESLDDPYSSEDTRTYYLATAIAYCVNAFQEADTALSDQLIQDNEAALEQILMQTQNLLTAISITEEEVQEILDLGEYYYIGEDVVPYAILARERIE